MARRDYQAKLSIHCSNVAEQPYRNPFFDPGYFDLQKPANAGGGLTGAGSSGGFGIGAGGGYNMFPQYGETGMPAEY